MATYPQIIRVLLSLVLLPFAFSGMAQSEQHEILPYCKLESAKSRKLVVPPSNAVEFRNLAKRHHPLGFGPPPSQTDRPGATWDLTNEFWYQEDGGYIVLYSNTDDNYMYHWRFRASGTRIRLVNHGLLECSGS